jgi:Sel1 repeat
VATGVLGKEFIKWKRDGRFTHIFNPSAFSLCVFSIFLIATNTTRVSWAQEISTTFHNPPNIYLVIFAVGLVVQALFSVTLVTLSATSALLLINAVYTGSTGVYYFVDSNLPVAVFLGLHLLVTDPATSPRTTLGKIMFGSLYGAGVFVLFGLLSRLGAPTLYDKLLCVPILNLSVPALDRASRAIAERFPRVRWSWSPRRANFAYMAVWITLFASVTYAGFLSLNHPGKDPEFWRRACQEGRLNACKTWVHVLHVRCSGNSGGDCFSLAQVVNEGRLVPRDPSEAADSFGRACDLGVPGGCAGLVDFVRAGGKDVLAQACEQGNGANCFILGSLYHTGQSVERDDRRAMALFQQSCASGWARGCGRLGESYMNGEGTVADPAKALDSFEKACQGRYGPSCYNVALIYHRGIGGRRDEALALQRLQQACAFGVASACGAGGSPAAASTTMPR